MVNEKSEYPRRYGKSIVMAGVVYIVAMKYH
jgi:hypothetical protein